MASEAQKRARRKYNAKPYVKKKRAKNNKARRMMEREGKVKKGDGKDVDHRIAQRKGGSTARKNLRVRSRSANRKDNGQKKGQKRAGRKR